NGYWQIRMKLEDQEKSSFITKQGTYAFKVMPFGLCNTPATFQQKYLMHITRVLAKLEAAGLKLNPKKCKMLKNNITFLGHIVGKE
ncbi:16266_t:CDS:2, partial [Dentiscutata heterogama]